jgi:hypothetical protein
MVMDVEFYFWFQEHLLKLQLMVFKHGLKMMIYIDCSFMSGVPETKNGFV